ncbi:MAG: hypothetical protein ACYDH5_04715 [Acidimicrobiales bacterium]
MRKLAASLVIVIGLALVAAPFAYSMWSRAPKGAAMISDFKPIMTPANVTLFTNNYMPTLAIGFGDVPAAMSAAASSFGHAHMSYAQAATFLSSHPSLAALAYLQQNFSSMAVPFTSMLTILNHDVGAYQGMAGLPPFYLFSFFFLPGAILAVAGALALRMQMGHTGRRRDGNGQKPVWVVIVVGTAMALAPFLPMPPGFGLVWNVAPRGAVMLSDFASPVAPGGPPVMSHRTVTLFNGYLSKMQAGHAEIVPAVQAVAAS